MEKCIVETLSYFDIFDYPLTLSELKKYLCCPLDINDEEFSELLDSIPIVQELEGYYYLLGRNKLPGLRQERKEISLQKLVKAKLVTKILSYIPTIEYIGVSGSLSMNNASNSDDIDLFFITKRNTLWITRFIVSVLLMALKQKRAKLSKNAKDKICPNMFMSADNLSFPNSRRNTYIAHEIVQLRKMYDRGNFGKLFIKKNNWILNFFPNLERHDIKVNNTSRKFLNFLKPIDSAFYAMQKLYMRKVKGQEKVSPGSAYFHPVNRQKIILDMYKIRSKKYLDLLAENYWIDSDEVRFYMDEKKIRILN